MSRAFDPVIRLDGIALPLDRASVDTDALIPKQYLKSIKRTGYGDWLFDDWRYLDAGDLETDVSARRINPDFILNDARYKGARILLARDNFGCGSSREHAVWALRDYGFRAILAPGFSDIFYNNCINNGILPARIMAEDMDRLFARATGPTAISITVDLDQQLVIAGYVSVPFMIEPARRARLMGGLDMIGVTLGKADKIRAFEGERRARNPWYFTTAFSAG